MDEQLVLTAQTLRLNPDLQRADISGEAFVVKNVPARKYLTVSVAQWNLLRNFANPATVPDVLRAVIQNRSCVPLREYYELVLKAHGAGVLQTARSSEPLARARRWWVSIPPIGAIVAAALAMCAAVFVLVARPFPTLGVWPQETLLGALIGWGLLIAGLSLGQLLAACVLHSGGGEIYDPRLKLLRPVPFLAVGLDDSTMTSRLTQVGIGCARLLPVAGTAAALWFYRPTWGLLHLAAFVVMLRPFFGGIVPEMLSTICRGHVLDTQRNFLFSLNQRWHIRLRLGLSRISLAYFVGRIGWGMVWIILVAFIVLRMTHQSVREIFGNAGYWREVGLVFGILAAAAFVAYLALPAWRVTWVFSRAKVAELRRLWRRWRVKAEQPISQEEIARLFAESLLFRRLTPADRAELLRSAQQRVFSAWSTIRQFQDKNSDVGVIVSGRVAVYRRTKAGRADRALLLAEGDVFGAHAMLDPERQLAQIRALTPVVALMIPATEFDRMVLRPLGGPLVNDLVHKVPFLRNVSFCATWHPQAVARFAQLASIVSYNEGDVIVAHGSESHQFYVIYEGRVRVKRGKKTKGKLQPGAFFGEVSILQNSTAVSDVVATEPVRCLTISKADFLRFVTHNPLVSLQLEEISSKRLGRPIFPLSPHSFDVR
ncbi:hypothetical protein DB347_16770 [Opitutaceae bacterium EW11]|nr:hypothetical protein DB347_16770 [Opitutaceae bacterium EW11]